MTTAAIAFFTVKGIYIWLWVLVVLSVQVWGLNPTIKSYKLLYTLRQANSVLTTTSRFKLYNIKSQEVPITKYRLWIWIKVLWLFDVHNLAIWMYTSLQLVVAIPGMRHTWLSYMYPHWFFWSEVWNYVMILQAGNFPLIIQNNTCMIMCQSHAYNNV